jgi:predicted flavoprotein YhiN
MLLQECAHGLVNIQHPEKVQAIHPIGENWEVITNLDNYACKNLVIATGGLPVPAIGASDFALQLAKQLAINIISPRPALVPLAFTSGIFSNMADFAGISLPVTISAGEAKRHYGHGYFMEDLLITHKGLSGPAVLQASSFLARRRFCSN